MTETILPVIERIRGGILCFYLRSFYIWWITFINDRITNALRKKKGAPVHSIFNLSKLQKDMKMSYKWTQGIDLYLAKKKRYICTLHSSAMYCISPFHLVLLVLYNCKLR